MYSLWRGNVLLGRINPELPGDGDGAVFGHLQPTVDFLPGQAVSQHSMAGWPGTPVFQHLHAFAPTTSHRKAASDGARTLDEVTRDSIPVADQLSLRHATNGVVSTRDITIMAMPRGGRSIQQSCTEAGVMFSGWVVIAVLAELERGNTSHV